MGIFSGLFGKTSGEGWAFDDQNGRLTISGLLKTDKGNPFDGIKKRVCSVVTLKGARIKNGSYLFSEMRNLTSAELSELKVSECKEFNSMFSGCVSLVSLDLTTWNVSNARDMCGMFERCVNLESIKAGTWWRFLFLVSAKGMFRNCSKLHELDMSTWSMPNLKDCKNMFSGCKSLEKLDLSSMNIAKVTNLYDLFEGCSSLRSLNLGGWNTSNASDMQGVFDGCTSLELLDLTGWHLSEDTKTDYMFRGVPKTVHVYANDETIIRLLPEGVEPEDCESPKPERESEPQSVPSAVKDEPALQPVPVTVKAEPEPQPKTEEFKAEPESQPKDEEIKAEPAPQPKVEEVKAEPAPQPEPEEIKVESEPQPKTEPETKPDNAQSQTPEERVASLAERNKNKDPEAAYQLALCFRDGTGTGKNEFRYLSMLIRAGQLGSSDAGAEIAKVDADRFFEFGQALYKQNRYLEAFHFFLTAGRRGKAQGWHNAGLMLENGKGIKKDIAKAIQCYKNGAEKGSVDAAVKLSSLYYDSEDVPKNEAEAFRWRLRAAELGFVPAMFLTAVCYYNGEHGAEKNSDQALFWAKKAKESGKLKAEEAIVDDMIQDLEDRNGVLAFVKGVAAAEANNHVEAVRQYQRSAEKGNPDSARMLSGAYSAGVGVAQDIKKALFWLKKAKENVIPGSHMLSETSKKIEEMTLKLACQNAFEANRAGNYAEAVELYQLAAELGSGAAARGLGLMYGQGQGVPKDGAESFRWMLYGAESGDADAMYLVALDYCAGINGGVKDSNQALFWAKKAKDSGKLAPDVPVDELISEITTGKIGDMALNKRMKDARSGNVDTMIILAANYAFGKIDAENNAVEAFYWASKAKASGKLDAEVVKLLDGILKCNKVTREYIKPEEVWYLADKMDSETAKALAVNINFVAEFMERHKSDIDVGIVDQLYEKSVIQLFVEPSRYQGLSFEEKVKLLSECPSEFKKMNNARDINKPEGQFREGVRYLNGDGVPKDMAKAAEYFEKAAKQGYKEAQCVLGHLYYWGKGVPRNTAKAKELFTKAAAQGFKEAKDALRELF